MRKGKLITELSKEEVLVDKMFYSTYLAEVNEQRRAAGQAELDLTDLETTERYGLRGD